MEQNGKKNFWQRLTTFDVPDGEFELLETETGEPPLFGRKKNGDGQQSAPEEENDDIPAGIRDVKDRFFRELHGEINTDVILRPFLIGGVLPALAVFMNGMADSDQINDFILKPAMRGNAMRHAEGDNAKFVLHSVFTMQEAELTKSWNDAKEAAKEGRTAVFLEGETCAILMDTRGYISRSVGTPQNETVVLGPNEAFTENIRTNVTLIRRIVKTDDLVVEFHPSGGRNRNRIAILYRAGVTNPALLAEVKRRFSAVNTLMVLSIGTLEQLTERHPFCPIPQSLTTERPDRVAAYIMQGHVGVLCEGSPHGALMPATLFSLMRSGQDAYLRQPIGTLIRIVRYLGALLSILMPAYFLALALHHQGMLSAEILATVSASRSMVFLPIGVELVFLLLVFQLVREAAISVPGAMGQSIGIIGGLVLGQAAVSANIVSTVVLIVVALSGLGNFAIPDMGTQLAASYFRIFLVLLAWLGGLLGFVTGILLAGAYLASLKSYGLPFLAPYAPKVFSNGPVLVRGRVTMHRNPADEMNPVEGGRACS